MDRIRGVLKGDGLLLIAAMIWGFYFVPQRSSMQVIGPFAFSAARFALGALALIPLLVWSKRRKRRDSPAQPKSEKMSLWRKMLGGALVGTVLFIAANLQQVGLIYTTAGNAAFISTLYIILVPLFSIFLGRSTNPRTWIGALLALVGLYFLSIQSGFTMATGDLLELVGAGFWAGQILLINHFATRMEALELALGQCVCCAILSFAAALIREPAPFAGVMPAALPILYGGLLSVGIGYTLQILAQRTAPPAHAALIFSMESLFAAVGGVLLLKEPLTQRLVLGGGFMLAGFIVSQWEPKSKDTVSVIQHQASD